jgi:hypothetical protein
MQTSSPTLITRQIFPFTSRFFYRIRPLLSLTFGCSFILMGYYFGLIEVGLSLWLGCSVMATELLVYPPLSLYTLIDNLKLNFKTAKSKFRLLGILCSYPLGLLLGSMLTNTAPSVIAALSTVVTTMHCSITSLIVCQLLGITVARYYRQHAYLGILLGAIISPFVPLSTFPIAVDVFTLSIIATSFAAAYLSKHICRLYYALRYGHSNTDGYHFSHQQTETPADQIQADLLGSTPTQINHLRTSTMDMIMGVKTATTYLEKAFGADKACTDEFRNILYLLMQAKNPDDKARLVQLISYTNAYQNNMKGTKPHTFTLWRNKLSARGARRDLGITLALMKQNKTFSANAPLEDAQEAIELHQAGIESAIIRCDRAMQDPELGNNFLLSLNSIK